MELKEQILQVLGLNKEEVKFEVQAKLVDGTIIVSTADALEVSVDVSVLTEDGTTIELPIGEYETEDGLTFVVEVAGVIASIGEAEETEEAPEEEVEETEEEELSEETTDEITEEEFDKVAFIDEVKAVVKDLVAQATSDIEELKSEIAELKGSNEKLETEKEELKAELSKQPATTPVGVNKFSEAKKTITKSDLGRMSAQDRFLHNLNNN